MNYIITVSLDEPLFIEDGQQVCLADIIQDEEVNIEDLVMNADLVERLPPPIREIGEKRVAGVALTSTERKRLERFLRKCPCPDDIGKN